MQKYTSAELDQRSGDRYRKSSTLPVCILLENVRSLHNVGSAFRTADAFRSEKIYLCGITGIPPHRGIQKTALGATESIPWQYFRNALETIRMLQETGYAIVPVEQTSKSIPLQNFHPDPKKKYCMVFGNEVQGITEELILAGDTVVEIPQSGVKHSLNVSVCLGVVMWEMYKKMHIPPL